MAEVTGVKKWIADVIKKRLLKYKRPYGKGWLRHATPAGVIGSSGPG